MNQNRALKKYRFPWRENNHFTLLVDGDVFYPDMLGAIEQAKTCIYLEMYLFESGVVASRFIDALMAASHRGVNIHVLLDAFGSLGLEDSDRARLQDANTSIHFYNPLQYGRLRRNLFRDHRKLLLIDGMTAYTGGMGITDDFDRASHPHYYWHEAVIHITGACVADWQTLFEDFWKRCTTRRIERYKSASLPKLASPQPGLVVESRSFTHSEIIRSFVNRIRGAQSRVWLATAYFVPSRKLLKALTRQAHSGIDVRILLPGPHSDHPWVRHMGRHFYSRLLRRGVRVYEYQPRFTHMKILLCDQWASIGSSNVDRWNFRWNLEANQEVDDPVFAHQVQQLFEKDFSSSREILATDWHKRPWVGRFKEWYWAKVVRLLSWISFNRKQ